MHSFAPPGRAAAVALAAVSALLLQPLAVAPAHAGVGCDGPLPLGDCTAPESTITAAPETTTTSTAASFEFTTESPEGRVSFQCRLERDGGQLVQDWTDCTDPVDPLVLFPTESTGRMLYTGLQRGSAYTFLVRAQDKQLSPLEAPNVETTPAEHTWQIVEPSSGADVGAPNTTITDGGARWHLWPYIGITYEADEATVGFRCSLNGATQQCGNGQANIFHLRPLDYTFRVAAVDEAGNVDPSPAVDTWTVPYDDQRLGASRGWKQKAARNHFQDTYSITTKKGATLQKAAKGFRSVAVVATKCPGCGTVQVFLGKTLLKKVSLAASARRTKRVIPIASWSRARSGTVKVVVASSGKDVMIDGLGISGRR